MRVVLILSLALTCTFGFFLTTRSWEGTIYSFREGHHRTPATASETLDLSHLQRSNLQMASERRLIEQASIEKSDESIGISLGHFTTQGPDGHETWACHIYNKIEMKFRSDDMSVSGSPSVMVVASDCLIDSDINKISTIWIPLSQIILHKPKDTNFTFTDEQLVSLKMENISDSWPRSWSLMFIRLFNSEIPEQQFDLDQEELRSFKMISFTW